MGFLRTHSVKAVFAVLCIAMSLVFASAAAASVVDAVQHSGPDRPHQHVAFSDISFNVHHGNHHADASGEQDRDQSGGAAHHHHGEGPSGYVAAVEASDHVPQRAVAATAPEPPGLAPSAPPGGLERPPKRTHAPV
jgi:hypothetical protein